VVARHSALARDYSERVGEVEECMLRAMNDGYVNKPHSLLHGCKSLPSMTGSSMLQGAAMVSLHRSPDSFTSLVQHPSPSCEHPGPPHVPQLRGQQTPDASNPGRPFEQVWSIRGWDCEVGRCRENARNIRGREK